ncbi:hypothetical protein KPH14_012808 [Odynerus spinipes]|uniref:Retrovirus-related Pol polyprotein from type-2 retrotransposable element R2DM n=1 Tax=Odynerus spinipes TaxID=1348599 RepID=A0AAD9RA86_9HYME|nr:hypothetical protein KPH14_012808 [Odynerus spinipes]
MDGPSVDDSAMSFGYSADYDSDECLSCPSCLIDLSVRVLSQRKQHIRRCSQPPPDLDGMFGCKVCPSKFKSYAGLRQHMKRSHPSEFNEQDLQLMVEMAPSSKSRWSNAEQKLLARLELNLPSDLMQKEINMRLAVLHPGRSVDSIKKQRLSQTYKSTLSALSNSRAFQTIIENEPLSPQSGTPSTTASRRSVCPSSPRIVLERIDSIAPWNRNVSPVRLEESLSPLIKNEKICVFLRNALGSCTSEIREIVNAALTSTSFEALDTLISSTMLNLTTNHIKPKSKRNPKSKWNKKQISKVKINIKKKGNRAVRRASTFSKYQQLFNKNPAQLAHAILDDKEVSTEAFPSMDAIEKEYQDLFSNCPVYHNSPLHPPEKTIDLDYPIASRETEINLRRLKQSAAGLDGITREVLRNMDLTDLTCLLNIVFGLCKTPSFLRHNRTVLIPKKGDLTLVSNWRPITISSLFSRLLHKILASRLADNIKLHHAQRGFTPGDGVMTSYTILDTIIKEHRLKGNPLYVLSIDLTKAFDKVHPLAIKEALVSKGVDTHTLNYIMSTYENVDTVLECHGNKSAPIKVCRGVRQGDTDSPILFNITIDDLVNGIDSSDGVKLGSIEIGCLLFADDIVLLSNSEYGMNEHLRTLEAFLQKTHMEINPLKCRALQLTRVPGSKRLVVNTAHLFQISGKSIPSLKVQEQFKYLGQNFSKYGMLAPSAANLESMLDRLKRAALRPWQKLFIFNRFLVPRIMHCNQSSNITAGKLDYMDRVIRKFIKATLHLPKTTPTAFLYAKIRDGGLSIPCLRHQIGVIYRRRLQCISLRGDPDFNAVFNTATFKKLLQKLDMICQNIQSSRNAIARHWALKLHESALGNGLKYSSSSSSSWILNPPPFWSGKDYIRAIQLRIGLLPTGGAPYINPVAAECRYPTCAGRRETLSHILQWCPVTHYQRIERHDRASKDLIEHLKSTGLDVHDAPRINTRDNRYIPDIIVIDKSSRKANIIETTIVWEHKDSLLEAACIKKEKYNIPEVLESIKQKYNLLELPAVLPFVVGARGGWAPCNDTIWKLYKLPKYLQRTIICNVLRYGSSIHRYFMAHVWRKRRKN